MLASLAEAVRTSPEALVGHAMCRLNAYLLAQLHVAREEASNRLLDLWPRYMKAHHLVIDRLWSVRAQPNALVHICQYQRNLITLLQTLQAQRGVFPSEGILVEYSEALCMARKWIGLLYFGPPDASPWDRLDVLTLLWSFGSLTWPSTKHLLWTFCRLTAQAASLAHDEIRGGERTAPHATPEPTHLTLISPAVPVLPDWLTPLDLLMMLTDQLLSVARATKTSNLILRTPNALEQVYACGVRFMQAQIKADRWLTPSRLLQLEQHINAHISNAFSTNEIPKSIPLIVDDARQPSAVPSASIEESSIDHKSTVESDIECLLSEAQGIPAPVIGPLPTVLPPHMTLTNVLRTPFIGKHAMEVLSNLWVRLLATDTYAHGVDPPQQSPGSLHAIRIHSPSKHLLSPTLETTPATSERYLWNLVVTPQINVIVSALYQAMDVSTADSLNQSKPQRILIVKLMALLAGYLTRQPCEEATTLVHNAILACSRARRESFPYRLLAAASAMQPSFHIVHISSLTLVVHAISADLTLMLPLLLYEQFPTHMSIPGLLSHRRTMNLALRFQVLVLDRLYAIATSSASRSTAGSTSQSTARLQYQPLCSPALHLGWHKTPPPPTPPRQAARRHMLSTSTPCSGIWSLPQLPSKTLLRAQGASTTSGSSDDATRLPRATASPSDGGNGPPIFSSLHIIRKMAQDCSAMPPAPMPLNQDLLMANPHTAGMFSISWFTDLPASIQRALRSLWPLPFYLSLYMTLYHHDLAVQVVFHHLFNPSSTSASSNCSGPTISGSGGGGSAGSGGSDAGRSNLAPSMTLLNYATMLLCKIIDGLHAHANVLPIFWSVPFALEEIFCLCVRALALLVHDWAAATPELRASANARSADVLTRLLLVRPSPVAVQACLDASLLTLDHQAPSPAPLNCPYVEQLERDLSLVHRHTATIAAAALV